MLCFRSRSLRRPNAHAYDTTDPSGLPEAEPSNEQASCAQDEVNDATGGWFVGGAAVTVTECVTSPVAPSSSLPRVAR